jgi:hypothetical protein
MPGVNRSVPRLGAAGLAIFRPLFFFPPVTIRSGANIIIVKRKQFERNGSPDAVGHTASINQEKGVAMTDETKNT